MKELLKLQAAAKMDNLPNIMKFLENSLEKFGLGEYEQFQTQIAVDEAVTNIIKYGELGEANKITITCQLEEDAFIVTIADKGKPFDPTTLSEPDIEAPLEERKTGGLGVYFIKKYMDKVQYDFIDGMNILTLIKYTK